MTKGKSTHWNLEMIRSNSRCQLHTPGMLSKKGAWYQRMGANKLQHLDAVTASSSLLRLVVSQLPPACKGQLYGHSAGCRQTCQPGRPLRTLHAPQRRCS